MIKVVAAFVAGVVVALGSALIYVRVSDMAHAQPLAETSIVPPDPLPPQLPDAGLDSAAKAAPSSHAADDQPVLPAHAEHAPKLKVIVESHRSYPKPESIKPAPRYQQASSPRKIEIAQNRQPSNPAITSPAPSIASAASAPAAPTPNEQQQPATEPAQSYSQQQPQSVPPPAPVRQPHVVTLRAGTTLAIRLGETLSTDHNYTGDTFRAALESPIIMDGFIIADRNSKVLGRIANARKAGRVEGLSDLTLTLTEINTTDGQRVRIDTSSFDQKGPASMGRDTAEIAAGAALGAIIGAAAGGGKGAGIGAGIGGAAGAGAVLATRGKPAVLPNETSLTFRLATPVTITEKLNF